jgi:hypothetical protein
MMRVAMKKAALPLCVIAFGLALACHAADLPAVQSVYLLPMSNGLDQHLANRLAASGVFRVVADPKQAQAIFTEKLGEAFEERLKTLLAPAEPKPSTEKKADDTPVPRVSSFGQGKGTIFLVDASTRTVLWSTYEKPRNSSPQEQDRSAQRIVDRLKAGLKPKQQ